MLSKKIGIDLGSSTVLVHVRGEGIVINEPSVAAIDPQDRVLAWGAQALAMVRTQATAVRSVWPMRDIGMVDFGFTEGLLKHLIGRGLGRQRLFRPELMICVPSWLSGGERRALAEVAIAAGARQAWLIDEPLAAAMGASLAINGPAGTAVCTIGAATTEVAVIALSGMVASMSVSGGGDGLDRAISVHLRRRHGLTVDDRGAEVVKVAVGSALVLGDAMTMEVEGTDAITALPRLITITSSEITEAIAEPLSAIATAVGAVLNQAPAHLADDVRGRGMILTGGGALLRNLDRYLLLQTGLQMVVTEDPQTCAARGAGAALEQFEVLKHNHYLR